jgi:predicted RNA-binding protein with PUA-like domain
MMFEERRRIRTMQYWLMKSEEDVYSIRDLEREGSTCWEGVRNYEARNIMRDGMKEGDLVLFYHSNADPPGVAGIARVVREAHPDHFAFDRKSNYFDPKSDPDNPRWLMVDVGWVETFPEKVSLARLREEDSLQEMALFTRKRLSVQPVEKDEFNRVVEMGRGG